MSLASRFNPKEARKNQEHPLKDAPDNPASIIKQLEEEYKYKPKDSVPKESVPLKHKDGNVSNEHKLIKFNDFIDMGLMCEERLSNKTYDIKSKAVHKIRQKYINELLLIYSDIEPIRTNIKIDDIPVVIEMYIYNSKIILPEELKHMSGFIREYLNEDKIYILYDTGEILSQKSKYCSFWTRNRIEYWLKWNTYQGTTPDILYPNACLKCNSLCQFRQKQQKDSLI